MGKNSFRWAFKILVLSVSLSIVFSLVSQSLFPSIPTFFSVFIILFFIVLSTVFDMLGIAVASINMDKLKKFEGQRGYETAKKLYKNTEKVSSFCGDVVGDICGILSGAGGVSLVVSMNISDPTLYYITTCLVSSFIAGLTIFSKAVMKGYAIKNAEELSIKVGRLIEFSPKEWLKNGKKNNNSSDSNTNKKL